MLDDWHTAPISERLRAAIGLAEALTLRSGEPPVEAVDRCRAHDLDPLAMEGVASVAFSFAFINRVAESLDFPLHDEVQNRRFAPFLDRGVRMATARARRPDPPWRHGPDGILRPSALDEVRTHLLEHEGPTPLDLRRSVEAHTARARGGTRDAPELTGPASLVRYLDKLALHAHRIVDEDVDAMRAEGLDSDAIFDLTIIGCVGAALVGFESLLPLLSPKSAPRSASAKSSARP